MRVLHVITALGVGGAERMLLKLLGSKALSGAQQRVVAMLPTGPLAEPMRATGATVEQLNFLGGLPILSGGVQLAAIARRYAPDLIHGWMYHGNLGAALARTAVNPKVPLVWSVRQSLPSLAGENAFARIGIYLNRWVSSRPDRLLFNSRASLQEHRDFGFDTRQALYLPNGFDTASFAPDASERSRWRASWGVGDDVVVFGLFARYHPSKDHAGFVRAAREVHEARGRTRFVLAGTGVEPNNEALLREIANARLGDHVHLLGERRDVASLLSALDVYVSSSSRIEAFSNSVGEAMSCALPCVVTNVGDSPFVVGETGLAVPPLDTAALAAAMVAMVDMGAEQRQALGECARQRVLSEFDIDAVAQRHGDLYRELVASGPRAH
ncbi:MAG: glycosyltransferase [Betaproteobacteria bacterium]|nr:glycosyltransferase [Betaproteobacteria bacterium]